MKSEKLSTVVWLRDDLRTTDHSAFAWAAKRGPIVALIIEEDPDSTGSRSLGAAARWWWCRSVANLATRLADYGVPLILRRGDPTTIVPEVAEHTGVTAATWHRRYHVPLQEVDRTVQRALENRRMEVRDHPGFLLTEPGTVLTHSGEPYKVFTPFSKAARSRVMGMDDRDAKPFSDDGHYDWQDMVNALPSSLHDNVVKPGMTTVAKTESDWTDSLKNHCRPGEESAQERLTSIIENLFDSNQDPGYDSGRDRPDLDITSGLSPYLRFGEISVKRVWDNVCRAASTATRIFSSNVNSFKSQLLWRDFSWSRLHERPDLHKINVREKFDRFGWEWDGQENQLISWRGLGTPDPRHATHDDEFHRELAAWRAGETGIPLVDAGMRELWETGTMHNRVRMVVGSLLTKNLQIHWRHGEEWFWEALVDADPASNAFNWQWVAGCGDDAAPYFRIFNPYTQAKRFDPEGKYVARWLETSDVDDGTDHRLSTPIVDIKLSRKNALTAYQSIT